MNNDNIKPHEFQPGKSGNLLGKPPGTKNRSTIARKILEMKALYKDDAFKQLQQQYPEITKDTTVEEMMTIIQVNKAIMSEDPNSYKAIMDSAYGAPKQEVDANITGAVNVINLGLGNPQDVITTETE